MISNLRISLVELVIWAVFATVGLTWTAARVFDGLERARDWWIDRRDSRESGVPVSGFRRLREWTRDRVTPLLEDEECPVCHDTYYDLEEHLESGAKGCGAAWLEEAPPLPPERTWEEMTSHDLPLVGAVVSGPLDRGWALAVDAHALLHPERERRAPWWEAEHRAAYEAMGFDYPSGLMARVRELTP